MHSNLPEANLFIQLQAPIQELRDHALEIFARVDRAHLIAQDSARRHVLRIPAYALAELQPRGALVAEAGEVDEVVAHELTLLLDRGLFRNYTGREVAPRVAEEPRHGEGGAADHDAGALGVTDHVGGVLRGADVAVADDGDVLYRGDDFGDAVEAGSARKSHLGGAAMDRNERDASVF